MHKSISHSMSGYTFVEMMISIAIIVIMVGVVVGTYSFGRQRDVLKSESEKFASAVRNARARAVGGTAIPVSVCESNRNKLCLIDDDCVGGTCVAFTCSLDINVNCNTNTQITDCSNNGKGHCTNARYPAGGFGVHIIVNDGGRSTYTIFANAENTGGPIPYYNVITEKIEKFTLPADLKMVLPASATAAEIVFNGTGTSVYRSIGGSWAADSSSNYTISLQHAVSCAEIGKKGDTTVEPGSGKIYEDQVDCS